MNRTELENKIKSLQAELAMTKEQLEAMPKKWEPKGCWCVDVDSKVDQCRDGEFSDFGNSFQSQEQAEKAAKAMRAHNRLLAYVAEFATDYEFQEGAANWFVCFNYDGGGWMADYTYDRMGGLVYMTEKCAHTLAYKLNSGEVEL